MTKLKICGVEKCISPMEVKGKGADVRGTTCDIPERVFSHVPDLSAGSVTSIVLGIVSLCLLEVVGNIGAKS